MEIIEAKLIEEAVYNLCIQANTAYNENLYKNICKKYTDCQNSKNTNSSQRLFNILKNIELSYKTKRPMCQDTGQVIVFVSIGENIHINGNLNDSINNAVKNAYCENYYRKSVVTNAIFNRNNTQTNTPAIIYTEISNKPNKIELNLMIKGAGSENYSSAKMFKPTSTKEEIFDFVKHTIDTAGEKACPPLVIGLGIGGTLDSAAILSKKTFFKENNSTEEENFIRELKNYLSNLENNILDIKIESSSTHIASLPVAITLNCHCTRHASCKISSKGIEYFEQKPQFINTKTSENNIKEIKTDNIDELKKLKKGEQILLTGEIYTARDAAHQKIYEYYKQYKKLPFDIKNKIIFYAGPCPAAPSEIIGPIGPTTSSRMDSYCEFLYTKGLIATIGKGERSIKAVESIEKNKRKYFTAQGGIACLLAQCVKKSEVIAFEELGTEAVRKLFIEKLPVTVEI